MTAPAPLGPTLSRPGSPQASNRGGAHKRLGVWFFAAVFVVAVPLFPVLVEAVKHQGVVRPETYLLTAAVLSVGFGFSSQAPSCWAAYALIFFGSLIYDYNPRATPPLMSWPEFLAGFESWVTSHLALSLLLLAAMLHTIERFMWHVVWNRPFPDWRQGD